MKWIGGRESDNVEDRRGISTGRIVTGGGIIGLIILLINIFGGPNAQMLTPILRQFQQQQVSVGVPRELTDEDKRMGKMSSTIFAYTEDIWTNIFLENKMIYQKPKMVLFSGAVQTACGGASSASGPFYCPADEKVYLDLDFFNELHDKFGAQGGDFTVAYVIAHEVGHHIQKLLGTTIKVEQAQRRLSQTEANKLSVNLELQADFYAGIWSRYFQENLDEGDIEQALSAAQAVGDDAIQRRTQGHIVPESFTHGTSEQRKYWFIKGYQTGDIRQGDTFSILSN